MHDAHIETENCSRSRVGTLAGTGLPRGWGEEKALEQHVTGFSVHVKLALEQLKLKLELDVDVEPALK